MTRHRQDNEATQIAQKTRDAHSFGAYAPGEWRRCVDMLLRDGRGGEEVETIMRSKWTRWACDESPKEYGQCTHEDLARFMSDPKMRQKYDSEAADE